MSSETAEKKARVLVVDDELTMRMTLCAQLTQPGFELREAESGEQALKMIREWPPDVILLDVMMPGMDGFEVCRLIKGDPRWETIPVIMCTALGTREHLLKGLLAGADEFLIKPIHGAELRLRVRNLLKVKAYHDLLQNVLPPRVARQLRSQPGPMAEAVPCATVLFADLVGFVTFSKDRQPGAVVQILDDIFSTFDALTSAQGLEKIKTIGDAYMLAGGLEEGQQPGEEALKVARVALSMQESLAQICAERGIELQLRAGIHSGPLIAGVIGQRRLAYDLWGDTVNVASRMESHGLPGRIQISESSYFLIRDGSSCEARGEVDVKGRGLMRTWWLQGVRSPS